jgi:hypothetical protein
MLSYCYKSTSFDLHVLGTPPAFILSQDQTLRENCHLLRDVKYGVIHWNYRLLLPITFQLLRYLPFERTVFYLPHNRLSRNYTDKNTDALSFHIGSSDCKTTRLVSLTGDGYSVVNDLSQGRDLFGMYWRTMIICTSPSLSIVIRHLNLKKSHQFSPRHIRRT